IALVSLLSLCWMYICLVTLNDQDEHSRSRIKICHDRHSLQLFALFQVVLREPLNLHWLHKVLIIFGFIFIVFGVTGISVKWQQEWPTVPFSLRATGPFLQFGAVGAITLLSPFIFKGSKFFIAAVFVVVCAAVLLCPLYIKNQCLCLIEPSDLPDKPKLIGHRGAPMLAPENTMMSFQRSIACGVTAFETDVQLSKDRIPFLMHDHNSGFLRRTTDVEQKFPDKIFNHSSDFTWEELQSLNAGEWFPKVRTGQEKNTASNQTIPSLRQLLKLAQENNISVIFDLYSPDKENDTEDVVDVILDSGIDPSLILWLPSTKREYVKKTAPGFIHIYNDIIGCFSWDLAEIKIYSIKMDVKVNLWVVNERWLFSLLWCAGASSVTTNSCHLLKDMERPDLAPQTYKIIWITVDIASALIMIGICIFHW
uniref:GP-PDE domain-containing protein n=1 Tax=Mola mola TaxID=94237 RepID=A0A3Q4AEN5_MOLML